MLLTFSQLSAIVCGAVSLEQTEKGVRFHRFTPEQFALYEKKSEKMFLKSKTSSGIKLSFRTDSETLFLRFLVEQDIGASFMSFDVFVDGVMLGSLNNFAGRELPQNYMKLEFPLGEFSGSFTLGKGEKNVTIHLPWNGIPFLQSLELEDGAMLIPVKPAGKLLALGDSITYGNAAMHPSNRYASKLCQALGLEEFNKGIGGERFCPDLAATRDDFEPDLILVAYGTNDWRKSTREEFYANVNGFFTALNQTYPGVKTIVITPTWRSNLHVKTNFDSMDQVIAAIREAASGRENTVIVDGMELVPHDVSYFGDYGCHPNEKGFEMYTQNLLKILQI